MLGAGAVTTGLNRDAVFGASGFSGSLIAASKQLGVFSISGFWPNSPPYNGFMGGVSFSGFFTPNNEPPFPEGKAAPPAGLAGALKREEAFSLSSVLTGSPNRDFC